jgi:hypothetical protein
MAASTAGRLPQPPPDLASRTLPIKRISGLLFRTHRSTQACLHFGKNGDCRFDDPLRKYGVLYAALKSDAAFAEVFLRQLSSMLISESDLLGRSLAEMRCQSIACVDLTGPGLHQLSCDNRISTEKPYGTVGRWSRAIFEHPQQPDGIIYLSRHNPRFKCLALFDRCHRHLKLKATDGLMSSGKRPWTAGQITKYKLAVQPYP